MLRAFLTTMQVRKRLVRDAEMPITATAPRQFILSTLTMSALFRFQSLLLAILLTICTCTYVRGIAPGLVDRNKEGFLGLIFKSARLGERLSPYVALACVAMAVRMLLQ